ncbi:hypothetical protein C8R43DRAFT_1122694 [Mycena crocata]|nr:hypothetical protein C8R43DRAFT_1122694 [Mycena crocata]
MTQNSSKVYCQPRFYPHVPEHADTIAHDRDPKGRYFVVGKGEAAGVFTSQQVFIHFFRSMVADFFLLFSVDANAQTNGHPNFRQQGAKLWSGVDVIWKGYCDELHPHGCPTRVAIPAGWEAPTPVVRTSPSTLSILPPSLPVPSANVPCASTSQAPSTPSKAQAASTSKSPLSAGDSPSPAWAAGRPWTGWNSPTPAAAPPGYAPGYISTPAASQSAPTPAVGTQNRERVTPSTRIELTSRRPQLDTIAAQRAATTSAPSPSQCSVSSVSSSQLSSDDEGTEDAHDVAAGDDAYWAVEGLEELFPTAEQAKAARSRSSVANPMLMRSADLGKLAAFGAGDA